MSIDTDPDGEVVQGIWGWLIGGALLLVVVIIGVLIWSLVKGSI